MVPPQYVHNDSAISSRSTWPYPSLYCEWLQRMQSQNNDDELAVPVGNIQRSASGSLISKYHPNGSKQQNASCVYQILSAQVIWITWINMDQMCQAFNHIGRSHFRVNSATTARPSSKNQMVPDQLAGPAYHGSKVNKGQPKKTQLLCLSCEYKYQKNCVEMCGVLSSYTTIYCLSWKGYHNELFVMYLTDPNGSWGCPRAGVSAGDPMQHPRSKALAVQELGWCRACSNNLPARAAHLADPFSDG